MALTYITTAEIRARLATAAGDNTNESWIEQAGYAAEDVVDRYTRGGVLGARCFDVSASGTRYFNDLNNGVIRIDDAQTVTTLTRGGTTLTVSTDYLLYPYNKGTGPYTEIHLLGSYTSLPVSVIFGSGYGYPYAGVGVRQVAVTGTWGFCAVANIPPAVKEATLRLAVLGVRFSNVKTVDLLQAVTNPTTHEWRAIQDLLCPYREYGRSVVA